MPTTETVEQLEKADILDALSYFKTKADNAYLGNSGGLYPIVKVRSETGNTVTMTKGNTTLTATEDNGYWTFTIPSYGEWTINATGANQYQRVVPINVDDVKIYQKDARTVHRYGYRIKKEESDPYARVEYLYDAVGMRPAYMNYISGKFDYGDWADAWFVKDNKPCMLDSDGTVAYLLDPNDYSLRADGETPSAIEDTDTTLNAMSAIPLVWVYRYEDDDYCYEIISDQKVDENYKAYAHTDANGNIKNYSYLSIYFASGDSNKLRSLSAKAPFSGTPAVLQTAVSANGTGWYAGTWAQHQLLRTLFVLMGKSTNTELIFGAVSSTALTSTGICNAVGQFKGYSNINTTKAFHIESMPSNNACFLNGLYSSGSATYAKMTPEADNFALNTDNAVLAFPIYLNSVGNITQIYINEYGAYPKAWSGSTTTYFCDAIDYTSSGFSVNATSYGSKMPKGMFAIGRYPSNYSIYARLAYV